MNKNKNKNKKFLTFVEGIVDDPILLKTIKHGYSVCMESLSQDGDDWTFELEEDIEYSYDIAVKYFNVKQLIYDYKKDTGIENVTADDITVSAKFTVSFDFDKAPYIMATNDSPEEGGYEFDGHTIKYVALYLMIEGNERDMIEIDDQEQIKTLDPMIRTVFNKTIEDHRYEILEKVESDDVDSDYDGELDNIDSVRYQRDIDNL